WLVADPTHIPNLTGWVLSQLRPVSDDSTTTATAPPYTTTAATAPYPRPTLDGMPIDILHRIAAFLAPPATLRLRRTSKSLFNRLPLPQSFWRDALTSGTLIPFLWDVDAHACRQHDRGSAVPLDWRGLARRLRCSHVFVQAALRKTLSGAAPVEGYGIGYLDFYASVAAQGGGEEDEWLVGAPPGLLNRCRIAQVVADVEAIEEEELLRDCHVPLSDEEEVYAAMWIVRVQRPEAFDEYRIRRSLELHGDLSEVAERESGRVMCRL
ncbi:F-box domain cyclin-like protein, partial [Macrophomina phaseolina MS6]